MLPVEIKNSINSFSQYIDSSSKFTGMDENRLFSHPVNVNFIENTILTLLQSEKYVSRVAELNRVPNYGFAKRVQALVESRKNNSLNVINKQDLYDDILDSVSVYQHIAWESYNPVVRLEIMNRKFITSYARNIILSPETLFSNYWSTADNTEFQDYEYNTESWGDGTWHPEHLFTNTIANKKAGYVHEFEVNVNANSDKHELGHKYNSEVYDFERSGGKFPSWQYTPNYRYYDRGPGGLREGGKSGRRTNFISGYDMSDLRTHKHGK